MKSSNHQQLAINSFNNLKGFASKMQQQARDAAKKLPSLDEMAAKDDYIHTEEFNVKGEKPEKQEQNAKPDEEIQANTPPSWSLIDKRIFQKEEPAAETVPLVPSSIPPRDETSMKSNHSQNGGSIIPAKEGPRKTAPMKPRSVMMSVVTDAMTATPASPEKEEEDENSIVSDSSSDSDGDEEDPILSMIRQDKGGGDKVKKKAPRQKSKKNKEEEPPKAHRFLSDMADAENQLETNNIQANEDQAPQIAITLPGTPKELGSWMKTMASNQMNKILKRTEPSSAAVAAAPPLASTWRKPVARNPLQEEYHSQDSSDLLGDDELKQLARLKQGNSGGGLRVMLGALYEHRQFAFIAFTLVLAGVVYFFKFGALEDGVI